MSDVNFAELAEQHVELLPPRTLLIQIGTFSSFLEANRPALGDSLGTSPEGTSPPSNKTVLVGALDF